jgi:amidase
MAGFSDYTDYDAVGLADLIRRRQVTPAEVLDAALDRMHRVQPDLNPVVWDMEKEARRTLADGVPDGPFTGVPFMLKDLHLFYAGVPTQNGCRFYRDFVPDHDNTLVARYKQAGLVVIAKTNTPEFGMCATTESVLHGPARNPWNRERSGGGSSGGSAIAVAAGVLPAAHATDGGGSIRIPASCCGLVGLKTTRLRTPQGPDAMESLQGVGHVVSRTVRDTAHLLDATAGREPGAPNWAPPQDRPFAAELGAPTGGLRVAVSKRVPPGGALDPACAEAVDRTAALLADLGHIVEEAEPAIDLDWLGQAWRANAAVYARAAVSRREQATGRTAGRDDLEPIMYLACEEAKRMSAPDYLRLVQDLHSFGRRLELFYDDYDVLLTPTLARRPPPLGEQAMTTEDIDGYFHQLIRYIPFTPPQNFSGQPAISLPLHWSDDGLPVGVQFATRFAGEGLLIRLACQLEQALPWKDRRPPVFAA